MKRYLLLACATAALLIALPFTLVAQRKTTNVKAPAAPLESFSGSVDVGVGETFTSLTKPGGLFERMNAGTLSGNLIVNITSDLTDENGAIALKHQTETGPGGYTILIRPSGGARVIEGRGSATIILSGADRVTINGTLNGERALTIRNTTYTSPTAIAFTGEAMDDGVTGCLLESAGEDFSFGVVTVLSQNHDARISIVGNSIRRWHQPNHQGPSQLVFIGGGASITVANNELSGYGKSSGAGIISYGSRDLVVSGNTIFGNHPIPGRLNPISVNGGSGTTVVSRNVIRDHFTYRFIGIELRDNQDMVLVSGNRIYNINHDANSSGFITPEFRGIEIGGGIPEATVRVTNNMISYGPLLPNHWTMSGIYDFRSAGTLEVSHNTVLMSGAGSQWHSWGFRRGTNSTVNVSLFGNIFFNDRTGGGSSFAVGDQSNGAGSWESDYNLYLGAGETPQSYFDRGTEMHGTPVDFDAWKAGTSRDANSITGLVETGLFTAENLFVSTSDLHLANLQTNPAVNGVTGSGLTRDFDGQIRPVGGMADIGADEADAAAGPTLTVSGRLTTAAGRGISNARVTLQGGGLTQPLTLSTSAFGYFSFDGVRSDEVYLVTVDAKRYSFASPNKVLSFVNSDTVINFTAEP